MDITVSGYGTQTIRFKNGFKPKIDLAYKLIEMSDNDFRIIDRGYDQDFYSCEIDLYDNVANVDQAILYLDNFLIADIPTVTLSNFNDGEKIFGENVNYTSNITASISQRSKRRGKKKNTFSFKIEFFALTSSLSFVSYVGDFPGIKCFKFDNISDTTIDYNIIHSYNSTPYLAQREIETLYFEGNGTAITKTQMSNLREFYRTNRGASFPIYNTNDIGVLNVFGPQYPSPIAFNVRIIDIEEVYVSPNYYDVKIILHGKPVLS